MNSHLVRGPLTTILGLTPLLEKFSDQPEKQKELVLRIQECATKLDKTILQINEQVELESQLFIEKEKKDNDKV